MILEFFPFSIRTSPARVELAPILFRWNPLQKADFGNIDCRVFSKLVLFGQE